MTLRPSQLETLRIVALLEIEFASWPEAADVAWEFRPLSVSAARSRLERLAAGGFLARMASQESYRRVFYRLTPQGRKMLDG